MEALRSNETPGQPASREVRSTLDRLHFVPVIPLWIYWVIVGFVAFLIGQFLITTFGERRVLTAQVVVPVVWKAERSDRERVSERLSHIFPCAAWQSRIVTGVVVLLGLYTVQQLGL